jgi:hypothetical protein
MFLHNHESGVNDIGVTQQATKIGFASALLFRPAYKLSKQMLGAILRNLALLDPLPYMEKSVYGTI